jgi:hypothetical protein
MQRRALIKQLVFATGAILVIPSCVQDTGKVSIPLKKLQIKGSDEKLMAELAETIIPTTNTPGAKDISAHLFVLNMIDDCYKTKDQQRFLKGLTTFKKKTDEQFGKSFVACSPVEKETLLKDLEAPRGGNTDLQYFYTVTKELTVQAYTSSKFYLTNIQVYQLVPGRYKGCVLIKN